MRAPNTPVSTGTPELAQLRAEALVERLRLVGRRGVG